MIFSVVVALAKEGLLVSVIATAADHTRVATGLISSLIDDIESEICLGFFIWYVLLYLIDLSVLPLIDDILMFVNLPDLRFPQTC